MNEVRGRGYFELYTEKWLAATKEGRYEDALNLAINAYRLSKDIGEAKFQFAAVVQMYSAAASLLEALDEQAQAVHKREQLCHFCGRGKDETRIMAGAHAFICEDCARSIHEEFVAVPNRQD